MAKSYEDITSTDCFHEDYELMVLYRPDTDMFLTSPDVMDITWGEDFSQAAKITYGRLVGYFMPKVGHTFKCIGVCVKYDIETHEFYPDWEDPFNIYKPEKEDNEDE
jgi:hypothetical protein